MVVISIMKMVLVLVKLVVKDLFMKTGKPKFIIGLFVSVIFCSSVIGAESTENRLLDTIVAGVMGNESLIKNISFDYVVDYNVSEAWCLKQLEFVQNTLPKGIEPRVPTLERTLRTGVLTFEENKFKIKSKIAAFSDGRIFRDEVVASNGIKLTELNFKDNTACISNNVDAREVDLTFDVRNFPVLFLDGQPLDSVLTAKDTAVTILGTEIIDGTVCQIIDIVQNFTAPDGVPKRVRRKCWLAPDKGYLVKRAISYDIALPNRPLSITNTSLIEIAPGIWYYTSVVFESYPLFLPKPDVILVLTLRRIVVNQQLSKDNFTVIFPEGCLVDDQIGGVIYKTGSSLEKQLEMLDRVVDETFDAISEEPNN